MSQHVLLWSERQNCLHIEPLDRMLSANRQAYRDNRPGDYRVLFIGTREEVDEAAKACHSTIDGRDLLRSTRAHLPLTKAHTEA